MATITGTTIINKAATILFDVNNVKWSRLELLGWLNDAQRAVVAMRPEAASTRATMQMVAGPRQNVPTAGWMLLDVICNMGTNGLVRGTAVKRVDGRIFDETNPSWQDATPVTAVTTAMYNVRDQTAFDVYPPSDGTGYLEVLYSLDPVDLAVEGSVIGVMDMYSPAMLDYMMFRAKSKSAPYNGPDAAQQAQSYFQSFVMFVTGDATVIGRLASGMGALLNAGPQLQGSVGDT